MGLKLAELEQGQDVQLHTILDLQFSRMSQDTGTALPFPNILLLKTSTECELISAEIELRKKRWQFLRFPSISFQSQASLKEADSYAPHKLISKQCNYKNLQYLPLNVLG